MLKTFGVPCLDSPKPQRNAVSKQHECCLHRPRHQLDAELLKENTFFQSTARTPNRRILQVRWRDPNRTGKHLHSGEENLWIDWLIVLLFQNLQKDVFTMPIDSSIPFTSVKCVARRTGLTRFLVMIEWFSYIGTRSCHNKLKMWKVPATSVAAPEHAGQKSQNPTRSPEESHKVSLHSVETEFEPWPIWIWNVSLWFLEF